MGTLGIAHDGDLLEPGQLVADKYELGAVIGRGGMGVVLRARHVVSGRSVALKLLHAGADDPTAVHRLVREARAATRVPHRHVADVYDVGEWRGRLYLVMELLEGEPLSQRIARQPLSCDEAVRLLLPVLHGLHAAHEAGVIHRDLKPANLFVTRDDHGQELIKVLDFGVCKLVDGREDCDLTDTGVTIGTPRSMAPEQVLDGKRVDRRVDVYAFAAILYEALSGCRLFEAEGRDQLVVRIATEDPIPLCDRAPGVPPALGQAVMQALSRQADERPPTMLALLETLERALLATPPARIEAPTPRPRRRRWFTAALVLGLCGVTAETWLTPSATSDASQRASRPTGSGQGVERATRSAASAASAGAAQTTPGKARSPSPPSAPPGADAGVAEAVPVPMPQARPTARRRRAKRQPAAVPRPAAPPPNEALEPAIVEVTRDQFL